jgi:hypothetical protein
MGPGRLHSEETKRKMSIAHLGKPFTQEHKDRIGNGNRNKVRTEEFKKNMAIIAKNRYKDPAERKKIGDSRRGKKATEMTKQHMSQAAIQTWIKRRAKQCIASADVNNS